jgi:hypothetical protein
MSHRNDYKDAARKALHKDPATATIWDRVRESMEEGGLDQTNAYQAFMTGRYVGEMLERGEYRTLTPEQQVELKAMRKEAKVWVAADKARREAKGWP